MTYRQRWATDLAMLSVVTIWGFANVMIKLALPGWASPGAFNAVRFSLGALLLSAAALGMEGSLRLPPGLLPQVALLGLVGNGLNQFLFIYGIAHGTAANTGLWVGVLPIAVTLVAGAFRQERITARVWVGAALSACGILLVVAGRGEGLRFGPGDLFMAGAITTWAGYTVFSRPLVLQASPLRVTAVAMLFGAAALAAAHTPVLLAQDYRAVPAISWVGLIYTGAMANALGFFLYIWSVRRLGPSRVALWGNLLPIVTAAGAFLVLGEDWLPVQWLGAVLVIAGVLLARWPDFFTRPRPRAR